MNSLLSRATMHEHAYHPVQINHHLERRDAEDLPEDLEKDEEKTVSFSSAMDTEEGQELEECTAPKSRAPQQTLCFRFVGCCCGVILSLTVYGLVLEELTSHHPVNEWLMTFLLCFVYACCGYIMMACGCRVNTSKTKNLPFPITKSKSKPALKEIMLVSFLAFASTITSFVSLRYVSFVTRTLGKSCKGIPVMVMGLILGKRFSWTKVVTVVLLSLGVALFLLGSSASVSNDSHSNSNRGLIMLTCALACDGALGAYVDRLVDRYPDLTAFEWMYRINTWKMIYTGTGFCLVSIFWSPSWPDFAASPGLILTLALSGATGQAWIFYTIQEFGALITTMIGTCRKVLSIVCSILLFGHAMNVQQTLGIVLSILALGFPWFVVSCSSSGDLTSIQVQSGSDTLTERRRHHEEDLLCEEETDSCSSGEEESMSRSIMS